MSQYSQLTFKGKFGKIQKTLGKYFVSWWDMNVWRPYWQIYILTQGGWESEFCSYYFAHFPTCSHSWQLCLSSPGCLADERHRRHLGLLRFFTIILGSIQTSQFSLRLNMFQHVQALPTLWNNKVTVGNPQVAWLFKRGKIREKWLVTRSQNGAKRQ